MVPSDRAVARTNPCQDRERQEIAECPHYLQQKGLYQDCEGRRTEAKELSAVKSLGSFIGIFLFLIFTLFLPTLAGNGESTIPVVGALLSPLKAAKTAYSVAFFMLVLKIIIHHWRIYCGFTYLDQLDDENLQGSNSLRSTTWLERWLDRTLLDRWLRAAFIITFPAFAALLRTESWILLLIIWGVQVLFMAIYDVCNETYLRRALERRRWWVYGSDALSISGVAIIIVAEIVRSDANAATIAFMSGSFSIVAILNCVTSGVETWKVYRKALKQNLRFAWLHLQGLADPSPEVARSGTS